MWCGGSNRKCGSKVRFTTKSNTKRLGLEHKVTWIGTQGDAPCEKFSREFHAKCVTLLSKERHLGRNSLENFTQSDAACGGRGVTLACKESEMCRGPGT